MYDRVIAAAMNVGGLSEQTAAIDVGAASNMDFPIDSSLVGVPSTSLRKIGRNDPCSCGSGKKYKHCHGALA
jgi:preprotein translocase subunit SecA